MASKTDIANMALRHLGSSAELANLDSDRTKEAAACRRFYTDARDATLRAFPWGFATVIDSLALVETEPNDEWLFSYRYPTGCLDFRRVLSGAGRGPCDRPVPFRVVSDSAGSLVLTDKDEAAAEWTTLVEDPTRYPADFRIALSYLLASLIAPSVTGGDSAKLGAQAYELYVRSIAVARANAGNEEMPDEPPDSEFITVRG